MSLYLFFLHCFLLLAVCCPESSFCEMNSYTNLMNKIKPNLAQGDLRGKLKRES